MSDQTKPQTEVEMAEGYITNAELALKIAHGFDGLEQIELLYRQLDAVRQAHAETRRVLDVARAVIRERYSHAAVVTRERDEARRERDEARFRPGLGDNHHNAAICPYCTPKAEADHA
jgi:hypothetical protein